MEWKDAINEAKTNLGYSQFEYIEDWSKVVEKAKETLAYEREQAYLDFCDKAQDEYREYLKSDRWKKLREEILVKNNFCCVDCKQKANQVHHIHYKFLGTEKESEFCVSLCRECHIKRHTLKRG